MEREKYTAEKIKFIEGHEDGLIYGAVDLVNSFNKQGLLLPVSEEAYKKLAKEKKLVVATDQNNKVIATASYSQEYENGIYEFGGWAVDGQHQQKGLGLKVLKTLLLGNIQWRTIAFGNKNSGPIFEKLGAEIIKNYSIIPQKAFELCINCPAKPIKGCCDTIYSLASVVLRFISEDMPPRQVERLVYGIGENSLNAFVGMKENWTKEEK